MKTIRFQTQEIVTRTYKVEVPDALSEGDLIFASDAACEIDYDADLDVYVQDGGEEYVPGSYQEIS